MHFETDRLILRKFTLADVDAAYEFDQHPEVQKYLGEGPVSREEVERRIREDLLGDYAKYGFGRMAVVHKKDQRVIGFSGLKRVEELGEVDIGWRLHFDYWGQGLATESARPILEYGLKELQLPRIIALAMPKNKASIRIMEKLGMRFIRNFLFDGVEAVWYEITREKILT
jgi:ribosomal-protein-alanine N-acetyltransferase